MGKALCPREGGQRPSDTEPRRARQDVTFPDGRTHARWFTFIVANVLPCVPSVLLGDRHGARTWVDLGRPLVRREAGDTCGSLGPLCPGQ